MTVTRDPHNLEQTYLRDTVNLTDRRILEIGCGEGRLTALYHQIAQGTIGVDVQMDALQTASANLSDKVDFAAADALSLPFRSGSFDSVIYAWSL